MNSVNVNFYIFDDSNRFLDGFIINAQTNSDTNKSDLNAVKPIIKKKFIAALRVDGYFLSVFSRMIKVSEHYSENVIKNLFQLLKITPLDGEINIKLQLIEPKSEIIDYAWNKRIINMISQRQHLEYTMSWLSTLGGAFSSLGDSFENYAKVAGNISIQQFKIAHQLGDPALIARSRLYLALSLIQLGKLSVAKKLIKNQYEVANNFKDVRLQNMCKGVWSKLQYVCKQKQNVVDNR